MKFSEKLAKLMGYNDEQFSWNDDECLENYVDWDSQLAKVLPFDYLKENGFARLKVGTKDDSKLRKKW